MSQTVLKTQRWKINKELVTRVINPITITEAYEVKAKLDSEGEYASYIEPMAYRVINRNDLLYLHTVVNLGELYEPVRLHVSYVPIETNRVVGLMVIYPDLLQTDSNQVTVIPLLDEPSPF